LSDSKNKWVFFKNANVIHLAEKQFDKSKNLLAKASKCGISSDITLAGYLDHLNELAIASKWSSFNDIIHMLEASKNMWPHLIYPSSLLANELENIGRADESKSIRSKMLNYYENSKKQKLDVPLEALDAIALIRLSSLENNLKKLNESKFTFPEAEYNKLLKAKFLLLDRLTTEAVSIAEIGSGIGLVKAYQIAVIGHESLRDDVLKFKPEGKSPEYLASFTKSMETTVEPLTKQALEFRETAIKKIEKDNILSSDNSWFLIKNDRSFIPEFFSETGSALMDKAGAR
jgi:hypothetical protein